MEAHPHKHCHSHKHTHQHSHHVEMVVSTTHAHEHSHGEREHVALWLGIFSLVLLFGAWLFPIAATVLEILSLLCGVFVTLPETLSSLRARRLDIETLMTLAALGAVFLGALFDAALLLALFSLGHALEHRALHKAQQAIQTLGMLRPDMAWVKQGDTQVQVPAARLRQGDHFVTKVGERLPLDGRIVEGHTSIEQSAITGESMPVERSVSEEVYAGSLNLVAPIVCEALRPAADSVISRMLRLVTEAESQKSQSQRFSESVERKIVPIVFVGIAFFVLVSLLLQKSLTETALQCVALLVAASPCALAISTPAAILSAISTAARHGILIKGGAPLELLADVKTFAFDKTGTLSTGTPKAETLVCMPRVTEAQLLARAASVETNSTHPLARAICEAAKQRALSLFPASAVQTVHGKGIEAQVEGHSIRLGKASFFKEIPVFLKEEAARLSALGQSTVFVQEDEALLGVIGLSDALRPEAKEVVQSLKQQGIQSVVMLSGDSPRVAEAVGAQLGIDQVHASLLPEEKQQIIQEFVSQQPVAMLGDGVNDAPALASATVGIAMGGAHNDVAMETAQIVLLGENLRMIPFMLQLAKKTRRIIWQNLSIAIGVSILLVLSTLLGLSHITEAVILHEGSTLIVAANALRLLRV